MNKDSWEVKKLGDIATYINGYSFKPSDWEDDGLPIIRIQNLNSSEAPYNYTTKRIDKKYVVNFGEILISWSASLGVYEWKGTSALLNQHIFKVQFDKIEINKFFFKYQVDRQIEEMFQHIHGATMKHITKKNFDNIRFLVPPPPIQEQIVKELDTLSDIITKKKEQLAELDKLAQATFYDMFGDPVENERNWSTKILNEIAPAIASKDNITPINNKYWLLNLDMIESDTGYITNYKYVSLSEIGNSTYKFDTTNLLYSKLRPYLNKVVNPTMSGYATTELVPLKPDIKYLNKVFLSYLLRSKYFVNYIKDKVTGAKMPRTDMNTFKNFSLIVPPLSLQTQFADKIEAIEQQKALINQSIADTQLLFDYTMDKYFN